MNILQHYFLDFKTLIFDLKTKQSGEKQRTMRKIITYGVSFVPLQDRYKNDLNLAIQLLQCNPSKYAAHKLDSVSTCLLWLCSIH